MTPAAERETPGKTKSLEQESYSTHARDGSDVVVAAGPLRARGDRRRSSSAVSGPGHPHGPLLGGPRGPLRHGGLPQVLSAHLRALRQRRRLPRGPAPARGGPGAGAPHLGGAGLLHLPRRGRRGATAAGRARPARLRLPGRPAARLCDRRARPARRALCLCIPVKEPSGEAGRDQVPAAGVATQEEQPLPGQTENLGSEFQPGLVERAQPLHVRQIELGRKRDCRQASLFSGGAQVPTQTGA